MGILCLGFKYKTCLIAEVEIKISVEWSNAQPL